jgi:DDE superfamily endonuclease
MWCIPTVGAEFVACMEDVLDLYAEPYDPTCPVVCFDEASKQLIIEIRQALAAKPGQVERLDCEYKRNGTRNLFMFLEPLAGWRHVEVTQRRTKRDWAYMMQWLVDDVYPEAICVRVVLDNLNTHVVSALYETFAPAAANRICKRLELHYTPKHGSWLNMAEIELSVFSRQAWGKYIPDEATLKGNIEIVENERNSSKATVNWRFTSRDARIKLHRLYPSPSH